MGWRDWTGVGERRWKTAPDEQVQPSKTVWDLLQLLIVPVILVGISLWWSESQDRRDKSREDQRIAADRAAAEQVRQDATLNDYIQQMSDLMLNTTLSSSKHGDVVRPVARTLTLTALRRLGGERKSEVVRFLLEARLVRAGGESPVSLAGADLAGANLTGADLTDANLWGANLGGANLGDASLRGASLGGGANLSGATLTYAELSRANLTDAKLRGAKLGGAVLTLANLTEADLRGANLTYADLTRANLGGANLTRANLTEANLTLANLKRADLTGAFTEADHTRADLTHADLEGADVAGAKGLPKRRR